MLRRFLRWLWRWFVPLASPAGFGEVKVVGENDVDGMVFALSLPEVSDKDVTHQVLQVTVGDKLIDKMTLDLDQRVVNYVVPQGAEYTLTLVNVDDAGNRSEAIVANYVAVDTFAPAKPDGFGQVVLTGEIEDYFEDEPSPAEEGSEGTAEPPA